MSHRSPAALLVFALLAGCDTADAPNRAPAFTVIPDGAVAVTTQPWRGELQAVDPDGDEVALRLLEAPEWLGLQAGGDGRGTLAGTPKRVDAGPATVRVEAGDGDQARVFTHDLEVTYDFAGVYETTSFSLATFFSECEVVESGEGALYRLELSPDGEAVVTARVNRDLIFFPIRGTYTAAADTLVVETRPDRTPVYDRWHITPDALVFIDASHRQPSCTHSITAGRVDAG